MAKSDKSKPKPSPGEESPTFEQSLAELQQIAVELDSGTLGLAESMKRFERGVALLRDCYRTLEDAEQKIEILTGFDADGTPRTKAFDATATADAAAPEAKRRAGHRKKTDDPSSDGGTDEESLF